MYSHLNHRVIEKLSSHKPFQLQHLVQRILNFQVDYDEMIVFQQFYYLFFRSFLYITFIHNCEFHINHNCILENCKIIYN